MALFAFDARPGGCRQIIVGGVGAGDQDDPDKESDKVSNDNPARPFQLPPATAEVKEALDDFERFGRRGAWERALKSLFSIPEAADDPLHRRREGDSSSPVSRKRHALLAALPGDGQAAYKTFHDADAKQAVRGGRRPQSGPPTWSGSTRPTSPPAIGDNAADRLGDLYFEQGRFDRAADCWQTILRERPDTDLSLGLVSLKAALALHRAGREPRRVQRRLRAELKAKPRRRDRLRSAASRAGRRRSSASLIGERSDGDRRGRQATALGRSPRPSLPTRSSRPGGSGFPQSVEAGHDPAGVDPVGVQRPQRDGADRLRRRA